VKKRPILFSFNDAVQGIVHVARSERNMRIHIAIGLLVVIFATVLGVSRLEMLALVLTIGVMLMCEMINTAVEEVVDFVSPDFHPWAGLIKNISAGAVLIAAMTSVAVGYLVFIDYLLRLDALIFRQTIPLHYLIVLTLVTVVLVIIAWKAGLGREQLLRGGMPSGHAAVAFALAAAIWETSRGLPVFAGYALAALVAQSRIEGKIHSWLEVVTGALVGTLITLLFFQIRA
jgi:diacylglycerol kinase (ATP)